jgi:hypothetical protein
MLKIGNLLLSNVKHYSVESLHCRGVDMEIFLHITLLCSWKTILKIINISVNRPTKIYMYLIECICWRGVVPFDNCFFFVILFVLHVHRFQCLIALVRSLTGYRVWADADLASQTSLSAYSSTCSQQGNLLSFYFIYYYCYYLVWLQLLLKLQHAFC